MYKKIFLLLIVCFFGYSAEWISFDGTPTPTPPTITILQNDNFAVVLNIKIHGIYSEDTTIADITYQKIWVPEEISTSEWGKPQIPILKKLIQIQPALGSVLSTSTIAETTYTGYNIFPYQLPSIDSLGQAPFYRDEIIYNSDTWYPTETAAKSGAAILKDLRIISLCVQPIKFNPSLQNMAVKKELNVTINFQGIDPENTIPAQPVISDLILDNLYDFMVLNYEPQVDTSIPIGGREGTWYWNYIILAADQFYNDLQTFVDWKVRKGCNVTIKKLSQVPNYSGSPADTFWIRDYLKTLYAQQQPPGGLVYVLLVGNETAIPLFTEWIFPQIGGIAYSDHYYACLVGTDEFEDVMLARLCMTTSSQITNSTSKVFAYERNPSSSWARNKVLLVAANNSPSRDIFEENKIHIRTDYLVQRQIPYIEKYKAQATALAISTALNTAGGTALVNYRGHGLKQAWMHRGSSQIWSVSNIHTLTNLNRYPIVFNICCNNAAIQASEETVVEAWLNASNKGAVGALGATRPSISWYYDPPERYGWLFDEEMFKYLYQPSNIYAMYRPIGGAVFAARNLMIHYGVAPYNDEYYMTMARVYLYNGDVDLRLWRADWGNLQVSHPDWIPRKKSSTFNVNVKRYITGQWHSVKEAHVCLYKPDEDIIERKLTDIFGNAQFTIRPQKWGNIYVTVTYSNCHPYEDIIAVATGAPNGPQGGELKNLNFTCDYTGCRFIKEKLLIQFNSPDKRDVSVKVYNSLGSIVSQAYKGQARVGLNQIAIDFGDLPTGIFFLEVIADDYRTVEKVIKLK